MTSKGMRESEGCWTLGEACICTFWQAYENFVVMVQSLSSDLLCRTQWTAACQASLSFTTQEVAWAAVHWATVGDMGRESRTSSETSARSEHISRLLAFHGPEQVTCQAWLSGTEEWLGMDDSSSLQWVLRADRKSTRLNSSHTLASRMPSSA